MPEYGYTIIDNAIFRDSRLSAKAKGLYCQMLSLPDNWEYSKAGLTTLFKDELISIESGLNELKKYGYLEIIQKRKPNGRIYYEYIIKKVSEPP